IADEVQTGLGRTGALWGVDHWNVAPDIITAAKALGGGVMPIGAFVAGPRVWQHFIDDPFFHTTTTGGNPLACVAAIATINVVLEEDLPRQAAAKGDYLMQRLQPLVEHYGSIYDRVTGKGLLIGQHFHDAEVGYQVASGLFRRGVLISGTLTSAQTVRIEPPLVIESDEIDEFLNRLEDTLRSVSGAPVTGDVLQFPALTPIEADVEKALTVGTDSASIGSNGHNGRGRHAARKAVKHSHGRSMKARSAAKAEIAEM
ncbi:MAG TPA: aminotransferase class III-fold pyridoxal phosphate-dependent enzyme, partial [Ktedonobacterales bacterium]|nr:aminotransferase class III-fold pyridoxal phosphate-dependent enzyme [Ktedonobacterales bacterium]